LMQKPSTCIPPCRIWVTICSSFMQVCSMQQYKATNGCVLPRDGRRCAPNL
jgi:hypothetical protein